MSNRRKSKVEKAERELRQPGLSAFRDPDSGEIVGTPFESVDYIEHADDCEGLMTYERVEAPYEVYECTRCGPVWFIIDGDEVSRGGPPPERNLKE